MAAQDQALRTNSIKKVIANSELNISPLYRLCGETAETVSHIAAECTALAQKQYKTWRLDKIAHSMR